MPKHSSKVAELVRNKYDWSVYEERDFVQPIIVSKDGMVLDGGHRVVMARELGKSIPAIVLDVEVVDLDPSELTTWLDFLDNEACHVPAPLTSEGDHSAPASKHE